MELIKETLFTQWTLMRSLRLILGIGAAIEGYRSKDWLLDTLALFLLFQALANVGYCAGGSCAIPKK